MSSNSKYETFEASQMPLLGEGIMKDIRWGACAMIHSIPGSDFVP